MPDTLPDSERLRHLLRSEISLKPAKADLRKAENWQAMGRVVERTQQHSGLSLKQFADAVERDERQIARWINAEERPQLETVFAVESLRGAVVVALAEIAGHRVEVETVVRVKRIA